MWEEKDTRKRGEKKFEEYRDLGKKGNLGSTGRREFGEHGMGSTGMTEYGKKGIWEQGNMGIRGTWEYGR